MMRLPEAALTQLLTLREALIEPGEIFWLPAELVLYRGEAKSRPCLVAATDGARAHLVPGTSKSATGARLVVEVGETRLIKRTEFDFSISFPVLLRDLVVLGQTAGALSPGRLVDIDTAIGASNLVALKRLVAT
jgi:hypothetical protein